MQRSMDTKLLPKSFYLLKVHIILLIVVAQHHLWTQFAPDLFKLLDGSSKMT